jgi:hypothetical protein
MGVELHQQAHRVLEAALSQHSAGTVFLPTIRPAC